MYLNALLDITLQLRRLEDTEQLLLAVRKAVTEIAGEALSTSVKSHRKHLERAPRRPYSDSKRWKLRSDYPKETRLSGVITVEHDEIRALGDGGGVIVNQQTVLSIRNVAAGERLATCLSQIAEYIRDQRERANKGL